MNSQDTSIIWLEEIATEMKTTKNTLQRRSYREKYGLPIGKFCGKLGAVRCKWEKWKLDRDNG